MSKIHTIDPQGILRVQDVETNRNLTAYGDEDMDKSDHLRVIGNALLRQIRLLARNDNQVADAIPLVGSIIPDFSNIYCAYGGGAEGYNSANYTLTQATSGTAAALAALGCPIQLAAGAATADQGVNLQSKLGIGPLANRFTYFRCSANIKVGTTNFGQMFLGLANADTTIIASGVMACTDYIGFRIIDADSAAGTVDFGLFDGVTEETLEAVATMVKGTEKLFEFICDGTYAFVYVDGALVGTITIADLPDATVLYPSFVCQAEGTDSITNDIKWAVFQAINASN